MERIIMSIPTFTTDFPFEERISVESFEAERLARRLALLEESIAQGERSLCNRINPRTGEPVPAACGGHRAQLVSNLETERALAECIRTMITSRT